MDIDERRQQTALFRYSLIRPLADPELSARERGALVRALVSVDHLGPDGRRVEVSAPTLRRWLRAWRAGGFDGLVPEVRAQPTRTAAEILERAEVLKREAPGRTAAQVARTLAEAGVGVVSARTLQRHFARLGLVRSSDGAQPAVLDVFRGDPVPPVVDRRWPARPGGCRPQLRRCARSWTTGAGPTFSGWKTKPLMVERIWSWTCRTRRSAAQVVVDLVNYREFFSADRVDKQLRSWAGASPTAVAEMPQRPSPEQDPAA